MQRRELLKALLPLPLFPTLTVKGFTKAAVAQIPPGHYMLFADVNAIDFDALAQSEAPEGVTIELIPVLLHSDRTIDDAIRIYPINAQFAPDDKEKV